MLQYIMNTLEFKSLKEQHALRLQEARDQNRIDAIIAELRKRVLDCERDRLAHRQDHRMEDLPTGL